MNIIKNMVADGYHVRVWPHHGSVTVSFSRGQAGNGEFEEHIGRGRTIKAAAKQAVKNKLW